MLPKLKPGLPPAGQDASGNGAQGLGPSAAAAEVQHAEPSGGDASVMVGRAAPEADRLDARKKEGQRRNQ